MRNILNLKVVWYLFFLIVVLPKCLVAGVPEVNLLMVTDVSTKSFSVIWSANEASSCSLEVYEDQEGLALVEGVVIEPHPVESGDLQIKTAAENNGVMKVRVTGLEPATTYYYKTITTSKSTSESTSYPDLAPYLPITTETQTVRTSISGQNIVPFSNDVMIHPCYLDDDTTPAEGTLLLATVEGANYPCTSFVGDSVALPYALIDLNNMFSTASHENYDLVKGQNLTLLNFRGISGNALITYAIPEDLSLTEIKSPSSALKPGWNMISLQLEPNDSSTATVLAPVIEYINSIWTYQNSSDSWSRFDKNNPFPWLNDLNDIHTNKGYWLFVNTETSLPVKGTFPTDLQQLYIGWNLIGSKSIETVPVLEAIASIQDKLNSIWTYDVKNDHWLRYDKNNPFPWLNDLQYVKPGVAYWVDMTEDCQW